jgi:hypothetical protein
VRQERQRRHILTSTAGQAAAAIDAQARRYQVRLRSWERFVAFWANIDRPANLLLFSSLFG